MLALDVSLSMCASDVEPNRLTVAQEAAKRFIESQESGTQVGLVAFAGIAQLIVPPTTDTDALTEAVDNLITARRTSVGSAIMRSVDALAEINPDISPVTVYSRPCLKASRTQTQKSLQPDIVVLLTDGASTRGVSPVIAAELARDRGVRVYTIGFGTESPLVMRCTPEQLGSDELNNRIGSGGFGTFGGRFGGRNYLQLDERTLVARGRDHRGRVLRRRERGRAHGSLRHDPSADREEEGPHGGLCGADRHKRPPDGIRSRPRPPLEPPAVSRPRIRLAGTQSGARASCPHPFVLLKIRRGGSL